MAPFAKAAAAADLPPGRGTLVQLGGRDIALFHLGGGRFCAIDNACLHKGGPLAEGELEGTIVTCPLHGWRYDVTTGRNADNPAVAVRSYPCQVVDGEVQVEL